MKYIFLVHSPITVLVANLIIEQEQLKREDIIFFTARGTKIKDEKYITYDFPYAETYDAIPQTRFFWISFRILNEFDKNLEKVIGLNNFKLYVPQNSIRGVELLVNHKQCKNFSIIEEGSASYYPFNYMNNLYGNFRRSFWDKIGYRNRIKEKYFYRPDYEKVYSITNEAFPGFRDKCILYIDKIKSALYDKFNNQAFLFYDNILLANNLQEGQVLKKLNEFLIQKQRFKKLFYKFHPNHTDAQKLEIRNLMHQNISLELEELDATFSGELLAINAKNLTFIVNLSSLGIYGVLFKHQVFSFSKWLCEVKIDSSLLYGNNSGYKEFLNAMPDIYKQHVYFLN